MQYVSSVIQRVVTCSDIICNMFRQLFHVSWCAQI